jgi:hypothetical protein
LSGKTLLLWYVHFTQTLFIYIASYNLHNIVSSPMT